jgi:hypothetical protein
MAIVEVRVVVKKMREGIEPLLAAMPVAAIRAGVMAGRAGPCDVGLTSAA